MKTKKSLSNTDNVQRVSEEDPEVKIKRMQALMRRHWPPVYYDRGAELYQCEVCSKKYKDIDDLYVDPECPWAAELIEKQT